MNVAVPASAPAVAAHPQPEDSRALRKARMHNSTQRVSGASESIWSQVAEIDHWNAYQSPATLLRRQVASALRSVVETWPSRPGHYARAPRPVWTHSHHDDSFLSASGKE